MAVHVLIDGYNLIRQSTTLKSEDDLALELGRDALLDRLRQYKRTRAHRITVVLTAPTNHCWLRSRSNKKV